MNVLFPNAILFSLCVVNPLISVISGFSPNVNMYKGWWILEDKPQPNGVPYTDQVYTGILSDPGHQDQELIQRRQFPWQKK